MADIKLQFSVVCEWSDGKNIGNIYNGFTPGIIDQFYIVNKWIWDEKDEGDFNENDTEQRFYQECKIIESGKKEKIISLSKSSNFRVKNSHTHNNRFPELELKKGLDYRIEVDLFTSEGKFIKSASIAFPLFVKSI